MSECDTNEMIVAEEPLRATPIPSFLQGDIEDAVRASVAKTTAQVERVIRTLLDAGINQRAIGVERSTDAVQVIVTVARDVTVF